MRPPSRSADWAGAGTWRPPCSFSPPISPATLRDRCWSSTAAWCCDRFPTPPLRVPMAMDMKQLEEKVKDIIVEELGVERDKITYDERFMTGRIDASHVTVGSAWYDYRGDSR